MYEPRIGHFRSSVVSINWASSLMFITSSVLTLLTIGTLLLNDVRSSNASCDICKME